MARSYRSIQLDFAKAKGQARKLEGVASNLKTLSNRQLGGTLSQLAQNWTGENSVKYIGKGRVLQGNIGSTAQAIQEVADAIREIAEVIYEAEMEAWERAHDRD